MLSIVAKLGAYLGVGTVVGTISALFGIGGGVLMVPAIIFLWHRAPHIAVATSLAVMIPGSIAGVMRHHFSYGAVDWRLAAGLMVGTVLGAYVIGAPLANHLPAETIKKGFGVILIISGLQMSGVLDFATAHFTNLMHMVVRLFG